MTEISQETDEERSERYLNDCIWTSPTRKGGTPCIGGTRGECGRRPTPSLFVSGQWVENHGGACSENSALQVCDRCGHRHVDRDFGQVLACVMEVPLEEGREMQRRILGRLES